MTRNATTLQERYDALRDKHAEMRDRLVDQRKEQFVSFTRLPNPWVYRDEIADQLVAVFGEEIRKVFAEHVERYGCALDDARRTCDYPMLRHEANDKAKAAGLLHPSLPTPPPLAYRDATLHELAARFVTMGFSVSTSFNPGPDCIYIRFASNLHQYFNLWMKLYDLFIPGVREYIQECNYSELSVDPMRLGSDNCNINLLHPNVIERAASSSRITRKRAIQIDRDIRECDAFLDEDRKNIMRCLNDVLKFHRIQESINNSRYVW